ncbi:hypothetical protein BT96DRAFT_912254 [Gymnopus androsaceus JB14]|uniref:Uncharacterized protein n=1 Tax=Gymnopus androsaceus JB14 TaxID=1447944 RepID=A0A6A4ILQ8_9AGAR|nr:hypothetical protein BT96DRAFT_912254 [Gymnopus androsaceus JB14]
MSSPESSFDPLKRREWQHPMDRKYHQGWIASLNRPGPRYREAEDTYRRALDDLRIAVERTDSLYNSLKSSHSFKYYLKYLQYQKNYWGYKRCFKHVDNKAFMDWVHSRCECVNEHLVTVDMAGQLLKMEKERPPPYAP